MFRIIFLIFSFLFFPATVFAQLDSLVFDVERTAIHPEQRGELRLHVAGMPFVLDNEYKSKLVKGYTLPGIWLDPTVSYQPLPNVKIALGAHMLHFWGAEKYPNFNYSELASWSGRNIQNGFHCVPIFRAQMQLTKNVNVVLGTLHGKSNHGLIAPLYNDELNLSGDPETGVQVIWDSPHFRLDSWVNWESFIFRKDTGQESFSFGLSTLVRPSGKKAAWQWYLPIQAVFQHRGGEINTEATDREIKTWLNAAAGVGVDVPLRMRWPASLNLEATAAYFGQQAGTLLPFDKGYGVLGKASLRVWRCKLGVGYWYCKDFVSILGNPLYGAMSISNEGLTLRKPKSLLVDAEYAHRLGEGVAWGIQAKLANQFATRSHSPEEGWREEKSTQNFSFGIYLRMSPSFLLKKF